MNVRTERQTESQTDRTNFMFMWGSLRLAPITKGVAQGDNVTFRRFLERRTDGFTQ